MQLLLPSSVIPFLWMIESGIIVPSCPGTSTSSVTSLSNPGYVTSVLKTLFVNVFFSASRS